MLLKTWNVFSHEYYLISNDLIIMPKANSMQWYSLQGVWLSNGTAAPVSNDISRGKCSPTAISGGQDPISNYHRVQGRFLLEGKNFLWRAFFSTWINNCLKKKRKNNFLQHGILESWNREEAELMVIFRGHENFHDEVDEQGIWRQLYFIAVISTFFFLVGNCFSFLVGPKNQLPASFLTFSRLFP